MNSSASLRTWYLDTIQHQASQELVLNFNTETSLAEEMADALCKGFGKQTTLELGAQSSSSKTGINWITLCHTKEIYKLHRMSSYSLIGPIDATETEMESLSNPSIVDGTVVLGNSSIHNASDA
ncbi:hypothetical protein VKT23_008821 [Stygiomarasmius scandens]|uniref:Uncharacterized protein n=1 Tax=Marasmiellus scandens TaxID=2682957 RepID=A0ABR1JIG5_9AGAR